MPSNQLCKTCINFIAKKNTCAFAMLFFPNNSFVNVSIYDNFCRGKWYDNGQIQVSPSQKTKFESLDCIDP